MKKHTITEKDPSKLQLEIGKSKKEQFQLRVGRRVRSAKASDTSAKKHLRRKIARLYTSLRKTSI